MIKATIVEVAGATPKTISEYIAHANEFDVRCIGREAMQHPSPQTVEEGLTRRDFYRSMKEARAIMDNQ